MSIKILSATNFGLEFIQVEVEVNVEEKRLPVFEITGLAEEKAERSKKRVRAALEGIGKDFSSKRITVNLKPLGAPKDDAYYDLPIAIGILSFQLGFKIPGLSLFFGELSDEGRTKHTKGGILLAEFAKKNGFKNVFLPRESANEAATVKGVNIYPVENLESLVSFLSRKKKMEKAEHKKPAKMAFYDLDMQAVETGEEAKRAMEIAAAGGHNVLMSGGLSSEKKELARALPGILPSLSERKSLEITKIHSVSGNVPKEGSLINLRPFRCPDNNASPVDLVGGGEEMRLGEMTLAHRGVIFLDGLENFQKASIKALERPLEDGYITFSKGKRSVIYPAKNILVASLKSCPCKKLGSEKICSCSKKEVEKYRKRALGPILERADIFLDFSSEEKFSTPVKEKNSDSSEKIRERVEEARRWQKKRFKEENIFTNSEMREKDIKKYAFLDQEAEKLLQKEVSVHSLSTDIYFKIVKVARTIADLDGKVSIEKHHISEALNYKIKESD